MFAKALYPVTLNRPIQETVAEAELAAGLGTRKFHLIHVLTPGLGDKEKAAARLKKLGGELEKKGLEAYAEVREGQPAKVICTAANLQQVDYIFMRGSCKNFLRRALLGSTAQDVMRLTDKPALVHKGCFKPDSGNPFNRIMFATDFGPAADRASAYVKAIGRFASWLVIVHAGKRAGDPFTESRRTHEIQRKLSRLHVALGDDYTTVETVSAVGSPVGVICRYADNLRVDLIVIGRFNRTSKQKIMGSTSEGVTGSVEASIFLVP